MREAPLRLRRRAQGARRRRGRAAAIAGEFCLCPVQHRRRRRQLRVPLRGSSTRSGAPPDGSRAHPHPRDPRRARRLSRSGRVRGEGSHGMVPPRRRIDRLPWHGSKAAVQALGPRSRGSVPSQGRHHVNKLPQASIIYNRSLFFSCRSHVGHILFSSVLHSISAYITKTCLVLW